MLVRRGVEDHVGLLAREQIVDQRRVLDVADDARDRQQRKVVGERRADLVNRGFRDVEKDELRGTEAGDLPAELGADRPAGAGHQRNAIAEPFGESCIVEHHRIATEQVVQLDRADCRQQRSPADQVVVRRHRQRLEPRRGADFGGPPAHRVRSRGQRDDDLAHAVLARIARELRNGPEHLHVAQHPAVLLRVVVEQADDAPLTAARQLVGEARARHAGAEHQHGLAERGERAVEPMLLPDPVREAIAGHDEDQHDRIEDQHAARHQRRLLQHDEHDGNEHRAEPRGEHDALQVDQAREAPQAAIQPEREEDRALQRHDPDQRPDDVADHRLAQIEVEAKEVDRDPREGSGDYVMREGQPGAPVCGLFHCTGKQRLRQ